MNAGTVALIFMAIAAGIIGANIAIKQTPLPKRISMQGGFGVTHVEKSET